MAHQRCDTCTVFTGQPVCQFPEHHSVDITENVPFKINELVESSPAFQFPVELFSHIDFAFAVIADNSAVRDAPKFLAFSIGIVETTRISP